MLTIDISIPGRVWEDFLDPACSSMQADLGLPQPERQRAGKGSRYIYRDVPQGVALDLAEYLYDRGDLLLGQGITDPYDVFEKAARATYRRGMTVAESIRHDEQAARVRAGSPGGTLDTANGTIQ